VTDDDVEDYQDDDDLEGDDEGSGPDLPDLAALFGGGGMPDLGSLVDGLASMQSMQDDEYEGRAGGGLVRIKANGRMDVRSVEIEPGAIGDGPDVDLTLMADLVLAALHDLTAQIAAAQQQAMGPLGDLLGPQQ
jgi:DNA-binding protein YbaB